jgi:hypothetical protein
MQSNDKAENNLPCHDDKIEVGKIYNLCEYTDDFVQSENDTILIRLSDGNYFVGSNKDKESTKDILLSKFNESSAIRKDTAHITSILLEQAVVYAEPTQNTAYYIAGNNEISFPICNENVKCNIKDELKELGYDSEQGIVLIDE